MSKVFPSDVAEPVILLKFVFERPGLIGLDNRFSAADLCEKGKARLSRIPMLRR
jgi:hypothetical protein